MLNLTLAALFFLGIHFGIAGTRMRDRLIGRVGLRAYLAAFSSASLVGIAWLSLAYGRAPYVELWGQLYTLRIPAMLLMFFAVLLAALGLTTPNPTTVGADGLLQRPEEAVKGVTRVTRHPFLSGVALWALVHLLINGDLASLLLFGSLGLLALGGPVSIDRRKARLLGSEWESFAARTSAVPFGAIAQGRNRMAWGEIGWWRFAAAVLVYVLLLYFHASLFGVPAYPISALG